MDDKKDKTPSPAFIRATSLDPYEMNEPKDNRYNGGKSVGGRLGAALSVGFAMLSDDEDLSDVIKMGVT